jgi:hypothetical protein
MFRDFSELPLDRQSPGMLPVWVRTVIVLACIVSFASITIGSQLLWAQLPSWVELGAFRHALTFFISFWILVTFFPPWPLSRALRVAVLLPIAHAVVIACAWPVWTAVSRFVRDADAATSVATQFPLMVVVGVTAVGFAAAAFVLARRRSGDWIHGFAMLALAELLLLGLWLPIACAASPGGYGEWWSVDEPLLAAPVQTLALIIGPPTLVAIAFTGFALRRPQRLPAVQGQIRTTLAVVLFIAVCSRVSASPRVMLLYSNFVPLLLAAALVAVLALCVLGAVSWWRLHAAQRTFARLERRSGKVTVDARGEGDRVAIGVEITSWLRGPRVIQAPFAVATAAGTLPVHGAELVAPISPSTTQLHVGERIAVLRDGDDVQVAGLTDAGGDPFRTSAAPLADRVFVSPLTPDRGGFASVALAMWRPAVAYLLIISTIALPALAAILGS